MQRAGPLFERTRRHVEMEGDNTPRLVGHRPGTCLLTLKMTSARPQWKGASRWAELATQSLLLIGIILALLGVINEAYAKEAVSSDWTTRSSRVGNFDPYVLTPEAERALKPLSSFRECAKGCPEMIVVPAGSFR